MEKTFITITHLDDFDASRFLYPGSKLRLKKTPNEYDDETIAVYSEKGSKYGYVANSSSSVARGTHSAGYIYRDFEQETICIVRFLMGDAAIAELSDPEESRFSGHLTQNRDSYVVKTSTEERK